MPSKAGVAVWAYCLMPNHVHLIVCPTTRDGLGAAHRRWANFINARGRWRGHLFDGRFASVAMDEGHLLTAVRYVALNPVRARLVRKAEDWPWSSVRAHLRGQDDGLVTVRPVLDRVDRFADLIESETESASPPCARRRPPAVRWEPRTSSPTWSAGSAVPSPAARQGASPPPRLASSSRCCSIVNDAPVTVFCHLSSPAMSVGAPAQRKPRRPWFAKPAGPWRAENPSASVICRNAYACLGFVVNAPQANCPRQSFNDHTPGGLPAHRR